VTAHWYGVLGVTPDADAEELRRAWRALAARWHPDQARAPAVAAAAEARLKVINEAWTLLSDPERRRAHDAELLALALAHTPSASWIDRVFGVRPRAPEPGRNRRYRATVPLADVVRGTERVVELPTWRACPGCDGAAWDPEGPPIVCGACGGRSEVVTRPVVRAAWDGCGACAGRGWVPARACPTCQGAGRVPDVERIVVPIPAGVRAGELLRVRGHGEPGEPMGDLLVEVQVEPDARFEVRGLDVVHRRAVPLWLALTGGRLEVATAWGPAVVTLPAGARAGDELRLPGWGVAHEGDQRVVLEIEWPQRLDADARAALEAWARALPAGTFPASERAAREVGS